MGVVAGREGTEPSHSSTRTSAEQPSTLSFSTNVMLVRRRAHVSHSRVQLPCPAVCQLPLVPVFKYLYDS